MLRLLERRQLLLGTLALLALRLVLSLFRDGPLVVADEAGYLLNARILTGGTPGELRLAPLYRGGYSAVIAPLVAIDADPRTVYRLVLVVNALLAASLAPLLHLLLTRRFHVPRRTAVWAALAAAAYPSITAFSQVALSENLLLPLTVVWLLLFGSLVDGRTRGSRTAWAVALGGCSAALYAVHGRMVVAFALAVAALLLLAVARRLEPVAAAAGLAAAGLGFAGVHALDRFLVSTNYGGHAPNEVGERLSSLGDAGGILAVARNLAGQAWYVAVATLGLLVLVAFQDGRRFLERLRRREADAGTLVLVVLLALGAGLLVVSALSFRDVDRPDMLIYGRYVEVVVPPLLALALARFALGRGRPRSGAAAGLVVAATAVVVGLRTGVHPAAPPNRWNVASLPFLTLQLRWASVAGAGLVASASVLVLAELRRRRPGAAVAGVVAAFAVVTAVVVHNPMLTGQDGVYPPGWTEPGPVNASSLAYDTSRYDVIGLYVYQWFLPHTRFTLYSGSGSPPARYVVSAASWQRLHPQARAVQVWRDPGRDQEILRTTPP
jgi:hypothetical protein